MDNASNSFQNPMPPSSYASPPSENMPSPPKRFGVVKIGVIVITVLMLAGLWWFIWQKQKPEPTSTSVFKKTGYDNACALVSKADVEAAFGARFEEFTKDKKEYRAGLNENNSSCTINEAHERTAKGALEFTSLQIAVDNFESEEVAKHKLDVMRQSVVIDGKLLDVTTEVPELANEAFFSKNQASGDTREYLFVRKGTRIFHFIAVKFNGIDSEKVRPQLIQIAKKALA